MPGRPHRREFLRRLAAAAGLPALAADSLAGPPIAPAPSRRAPTPSAVGAPVRMLTPRIGVCEGSVRVGFVLDGSRALWIDCGEGEAASALASRGIRAPETVLFTHHHREQACVAHDLARGGARLVVPEAERHLFADVEAYWSEPRTRWHIYGFRPQHRVLTESVPVAGTVGDGDVLGWGGAVVRAFSTPGHTDGALSYAVEDGGRRIVFAGDTLCGDGRLWDIHSLQKGKGTMDYHGFLGARDELTCSLERIRSFRPDLVVPSHGPVVTRPAEAIDTLRRRLDACYDRYVATSALRHYFPHLFREFEGREHHMAIRPGHPPPDCLLHVGTTWILRASTGEALVMDCGSDRVVEELLRMRKRGDIGAVEGLWVTHYHDDHVDAIPRFQATFDAPCITDQHVAMVISDPRAWRLPCVSPSRARVDRATRSGESWTWRDYRLTAFHFPGQTLYHAALFVEGRGLRMLFVGDSFTPGGMDDYCAGNRNWLGRGLGFDACVALIERLRPTHIFNCHVGVAFDFTPGQCRQMRENLIERERVFGDLVAREHPNFASDEAWVRTWPYEQDVRPGERARVEVVVTNHAASERPVAVRAVPPRSWGRAATGSAAAGSSRGWAGPHRDFRLATTIDVPADAAPGRQVVTFDVEFGSRRLPRRVDALLIVESG